jgi:hypothetical protein
MWTEDGWEPDDDKTKPHAITERDATIATLRAASDREKMMFVFMTALLQNTYSPEVVTLAFYSAVGTAREMRLDEDAIREVVLAVEKYWNANRKFAGMF